MQLFFLPWTLCFLAHAGGSVLPEAEEPADARARSAAFSDAWDLNAELNYSDQSGRHSLQVFSAGINLSHQREDEIRFEGSLRSRYGRSDQEVVARNHHGAMSLDLYPTERWSPFLFSELERDALSRLGLRVSSGGGAKYTIARTPDGDEVTSISLALLHSYERTYPEPEERLIGDPVPPAFSEHRGRWSLRVRGRHDIREGVQVRYRSFYQPVWNELADYLLRSEAGLRIDLTERLGLSMVYEWDRDTAPSSAAEPDERLFRTGVVLSL